MNFVVIVKESYHSCNSWQAFPAHVVFYVVAVAKVVSKDFDKKNTPLHCFSLYRMIDKCQILYTVHLDTRKEFLRVWALADKEVCALTFFSFSQNP